MCDANTDYDFDQLVTCDLCGIAVHQVRAGGWVGGWERGLYPARARMRAAWLGVQGHRVRAFGSHPRPRTRAPACAELLRHPGASRHG